MDLKNFLLIIILFSSTLIYAQTSDQQALGEIALVPNIFLGDEEGQDTQLDDDGLVFATLENNDADECEINWEGIFEPIDPQITSASHEFFTSGTKTVFYRCKLQDQDFVMVDDSIEVSLILELNVFSPTPGIYNN